MRGSSIRLLEDGFEQAVTLGLGRGELCFQPITQGHQFVDFRNNVVLLAFPVPTLSPQFTYRP